MPADSTRPNILFVQTDQQRPEWLEMNPNVPVRTPHLRQLSERGRWLTNAVCPSPYARRRAPVWWPAGNTTAPRCGGIAHTRRKEWPSISNACATKPDIT